MADPFTLVYNSVWDMLETTDFKALVKVGNRIKFSTASYRDAKKLASLSEGRPTVGVLDVGMEPNLEATSNATFITARYQVLLVCGDSRVDKELYPIAWEVYRAMLKWWDTLRMLVYPDPGGSIFVHLAQPTTFSSVYFDPSENLGIKGWVGRWNYEVHMNFQTLAIKL